MPNNIKYNNNYVKTYKLKINAFKILIHINKYYISYKIAYPIQNDQT